MATGGHRQHRPRQSRIRFFRSSSSHGAARKPLSHTVARCPTQSRWATRASPSAAPQSHAADMLQVCRAVALLLTEVGWWPRGPDRSPFRWAEDKLRSISASKRMRYVHTLTSSFKGQSNKARAGLMAEGRLGERGKCSFVPSFLDTV